jgi:hypothetical protein
MKKAHINPALKELEVLAGRWVMELSNAAFLPGPKAVARMSVMCEWFEDGDFLVMYQGTRGVGMPLATWFIGRDQDASDYTVLYIDDRRVSRVYQMSFAKGVWKLWRNSPKFSQRFIGRVSRDKKTITASWEKSAEGKKWEHDFDIKYIRQS